MQKKKKQSNLPIEPFDIINTGPAVVFILQNKKNRPVEFVSRNVRKLSGYSARKFISGELSYTDIVHPKDLEQIENEIKRCADQREKKNCPHKPYRIIDKEKRIKWVEAETCVKRNAAGKATHFQHTVLDITRTVEMEQKLRFQNRIALILSTTAPLNKTLDSLLESVLQMEEIDSGGVYLVDGKTGGLDLAAHKGLSKEFVKIASRYEADAPQARLVLSGKISYNTYDNLSFAMDNVRKGEGLLVLAVIPIKHKGRVIASLHIASHTHGEISKNVRDIIESFALHIGNIIARLTAEEELLRVEERFRLIVKNSSDIMVIINPDGVQRYVSQAAERITGFAPHELVGKGLPEIIHPDDMDEVMKAWEKAVANPDMILSVEYRHIHKNGGWVNLEAVGQSFIDDPVVNGVITSVRDVTERKRVEEELGKYRDQLEELVKERTKELEEAQSRLLRREKFATLGKITATVSHELRNPLATIRASLFSLSERLKGREPRIQLALERAERNIDRCDKIIEDLLSYTRHRELKLVITDIDSWLAQELSEYRMPPDISFTQNLKSGVEMMIDRDRFRRCVINIIDNAIQAMEYDEGRGGDREISIKSYISGKRLKIDIKDTGHGIPAESLDRIFEELYSSKATGAGLGLPYVKQTVEQHGGGIEVKSKIKKGTTVTLWLPLER